MTIREIRKISNDLESKFDLRTKVCHLWRILKLVDISPTSMLNCILPQPKSQIKNVPDARWILWKTISIYVWTVFLSMKYAMHSMHHSSYLLVHFTCIFSFLPIQIVLNLSQKKKKKEKEKTKTVCYKRKCQLSRITT